jgi:hypothetical protein
MSPAEMIPSVQDKFKFTVDCLTRSFESWQRIQTDHQHRKIKPIFLAGTAKVKVEDISLEMPFTSDHHLQCVDKDDNASHVFSSDGFEKNPGSFKEACKDLRGSRNIPRENNFEDIGVKDDEIGGLQFEIRGADTNRAIVAVRTAEVCHTPSEVGSDKDDDGYSSNLSDEQDTAASAKQVKKPAAGYSKK